MSYLEFFIAVHRGDAHSCVELALATCSRFGAISGQVLGEDRFVLLHHCKETGSSLCLCATSVCFV